MIVRYFLCQWANIQNQQGFFTVHVPVVMNIQTWVEGNIKEVTTVFLKSQVKTTRGRVWRV